MILLSTIRIEELLNLNIINLPKSILGKKQSTKESVDLISRIKLNLK
jgi:hypothetical protein